MSRIGIMQGRLGPPEEARFQSFPRARWREEFAAAAAVPLSYIEWIYDGYGADENPIMAEERLGELKSLIQSTGVLMPSLCADYFMEEPLLSSQESHRLLRRLMENCSKIGIERIVLPFVDNSEIKQDQLGPATQVIKEAANWAAATGVEIHLETSLPPSQFAELLQQVAHPMVKVNYDSGNSASLGYAPEEEFAALGPWIGSVHIKDRRRGGGTVPLGQGDADFPALFQELRKISYTGDFTLQVARGVPCQEISWAKMNVDFVRQFWTA